MSNVIRPTFSARPKLDNASPAVKEQVLRLFGRAAGYDVALIHDEDGNQDLVLKVVVGLTDGAEVEAVAILPATPAGSADAEVVGTRMLRTLEMIEATRRGR